MISCYCARITIGFSIYGISSFWSAIITGERSTFQNILSNTIVADSLQFEVVYSINSVGCSCGLDCGGAD